MLKSKSETGKILVKCHIKKVLNNDSVHNLIAKLIAFMAGVGEFII